MLYLFIRVTFRFELSRPFELFLGKFQRTTIPVPWLAAGYLSAEKRERIAQAIEEAGITPDMATEEMCDALIAQFTDASFSYSGLTGESSWSTTGEVTKTPKGMVIEGGVYMPLDAE